MPSYSLEEATEYEYLKNILYQYMLGKEPLTLAKVLATVVKFTPEQMSAFQAGHAPELMKRILYTDSFYTYTVRAVSL